MKVRKKTLVLLALAVAVGLSAVAGTVAWFTAKARTVTNVFFVGSFDPPTTPPGTLSEAEKAKFDADALTFLFEPGFSTNAALIQPGVSVAKDPYVGIGKNSPTGAYVYVYIQNEFGPSVYFTLNEGWEAVEGQTVAGTAADSYSSGLFRYAAGGTLTELIVTADADAWTTQPVFSQVTTDAMADLSAMPEEGAVTVYAKIYEPNAGQEAIAADAASWAETLKG